MTLTEHDNVIEKLSATRPDPTLDNWVLPGTSKCRPCGLGAEGADADLDAPSKYGVVVVDQISRSPVERKGLPQLLDDPRCVRMTGHRDMDYIASLMEDCEPDIQDLKRRGGHCKEVHRRDAVGMVPKKGRPAFTVSGGDGRLGMSRRTCFGNVEAQLSQLRAHPWASPATILESYPADQAAKLTVDSRSTAARRFRLPSPEQAKATSMPTNHRIRLNDDESASPMGPQLRHHHPERPVQGAERRPWNAQPSGPRAVGAVRDSPRPGLSGFLLPPQRHRTAGRPTGASLRSCRMWPRPASDAYAIDVGQACAKPSRLLEDRFWPTTGSVSHRPHEPGSVLQDHVNVLMA